MSKHQTNITAHSGCDGTEDNSMAFVHYALEQGADCLEVDVRAAADGTLVLGHDGIDGKAVRLSEVFSALRERPEVRINCDLKEPGLEQPVYALAEQFGVEGQLIYSGTVALETLSQKTVLFPKAEIYLNIEQLQPELEAPQSGKTMEEGEMKTLIREALLKASQYDQLSCINMEYHLLTKETLQELKKRNLTASAWTVNEAEAARRLLSDGIANITTRALKTTLRLRAELEQGAGQACGSHGAAPETEAFSRAEGRQQ